jgi:O-antigen/teichoic acid export membrane protein
MVALALLAEPLVRVVLTEKWLPMVPYLQLFCIIGFLEPRYRLITQALLACGRSEDALRLSIYRRLVDLVVLAFTFDKGLIWIVGGQVASFGVGRFVDEVIMRRSLVYRIRDQWVDSVPVIVTSLFMFSFIESVGHLVKNRALGYLCISMVPVGFSFAIGFFLFKRDMMTKTIKRLLSQPVSAAK